MEKIIGKDDELQLNKSDVYVINDSMGIVYLKGIKKGDRIYYQKEGNKINEVIEELSKKKIRVLVQGYGTVEGGTAEGTRYKEGEKVTLIAKTQTKTINEVEYTSEFKGWYLDGKLQSTDTTYVIEVTKDATYTAIFDMEPTLIYYLDSNSEEQILVTKDATINSTTYTDAGIDKTQITKVVFGSTCTGIGPRAFYECVSIERVEIPNAGNTGYAYHPFENCTGLKEVVLGEMGKPASDSGAGIFYGCTQKDMTIKVYVEDGVTSFANEPWGATSATVEYYSSTTGELVNLILGREYQGNTEINWAEIPNADKVTKIRENAFNGCTNLSITSLPNNIKSIENSTFRSCINIKIEKIPEGVTTIGPGAFYGCTSIERLEIPNAGNTSYGWHPFENCTGLKEVVLGEMGKPASDSGAGIFYGCTQKDMTIKVYVEDGVTSLANEPWGATSATIEYYSSTTGELVNLILGRKYQGNAEINWTEIPNADKVTKIRENAFNGCTNLAITSLPNNIKSIEGSTFRDCANIKIEKIPEGVTSIGPYAFYKCTSIERLEIPNADNTSYGYHPFENCTGLKEVVLGGKGKPVSNIGAGVFYGCTQKDMTIKVYVEDGVTNLANAPWGATNATVEYYSATTGELISN